MRRIVIAAASLCVLSSPAAAQEIFTPRAGADVARALPPAAEVEAMGDAVDQVLGAVMNMPVGPIVDAIDAADPYGRRDRRHHPRDRTLGDVASGGDPYFEERLRDTIHGTTAVMGRTMEQIAIAAPVLSRALGQMERDLERAIDDARERRERGDYKRR